MMKRIAAALLVVASAVLVLSSPGLAKERGKAWAAQAVISTPEFSELGPVRWGATEKEAEKNALQACRKVAKSCGAVPATARVSTYRLFVTTCCNKDRNCQITPTAMDEDAGRQEGKETAIANMRAAGLPVKDCHVVAVYGLKSGKKLRN